MNEEMEYKERIYNHMFNYKENLRVAKLIESLKDEVKEGSFYENEPNCFKIEDGKITHIIIINNTNKEEIDEVFFNIISEVLYERAYPLCLAEFNSYTKNMYSDGEKVFYTMLKNENEKEK